jgi:hypothetical protein
MSGNHTVAATHLECVYDDHNKYYRTYVVSPENGETKGTFLVRNWGRRSAPKGQWMRDPVSGSGTRGKALDLQYQKHDKSYAFVHETSFEIPTQLAELLLDAPSKMLNDVDCLAVTAAFEAQWCLDICETAVEEPGEEYLVWITDWNETLSARAPARAMRDRLEGRILHLEPNRDLAVARVAANEIEPLSGAFDAVETAAAKELDNADTAVIATRLWAPESSGPYKSLTNAVRDARRLFRRV